VTWLLASFLLACSGGAAPEALAGSVTLVYSGNVDGEIEPCG
jgi:hypothetical protein